MSGAGVSGAGIGMNSAGAIEWHIHLGASVTVHSVACYAQQYIPISSSQVEHRLVCCRSPAYSTASPRLGQTRQLLARRMHQLQHRLTSSAPAGPLGGVNAQQWCAKGRHQEGRRPPGCTIEIVIICHFDTVQPESTRVLAHCATTITPHSAPAQSQTAVTPCHCAV